MTPTQRHTEFRRLFDALPGPRQIDRIRRVTAVLFCAESTVRQWIMDTPPRIIPEAKLRILERDTARRRR